MKRWFMLLAVILLMTGCGRETPGSTETEPQEQLPLMSWDLPGDGLTLVDTMDGDLLMHDGTQLMLLSADNREILAAAVLEHLQAASVSDIQAGDQGVCYYDRQTQTLCFLDESLQKVSYLELQGQVQGSVLLTEDWDRLYYCTADGVQSLDMDTGICRTIAYREEDWLGVNCVFMDTMLSCNIQQPDGTVGTLIISSETGQTLWETGKVSQLSSSSDLYFCKMTSDTLEEWVFGWGGDQPLNFWPPEDVSILPLLENEMVVTRQEDRFSCYDLELGCRVAEVAFDGAADIDRLVYLQDGVYFTDGSMLYRWDLELTAVEDPEVCTSYRYTLGDPDEEGLRAQEMSTFVLEKLYDVNILMWNDVTAAAPKGYEFAVEYIPEEYPERLRELESALDTFGRDFLLRAGEGTANGHINIVLVRDIVFGGESLSGIQYVLNGDIYIALKLEGGLERTFYHMMGHVVDTVVLCYSLALDDWEKLNPKDFSYDNNYEANLERDGSAYLQEDDRWFIDTYSMSFQVEDRATILEYAILPENDHYFASDAMQKKLQTLCLGIREAFELSGEGYLWEQYLIGE